MIDMIAGWLFIIGEWPWSTIWAVYGAVGVIATLRDYYKDEKEINSLESVFHFAGCGVFWPFWAFEGVTSFIIRYSPIGLWNYLIRRKVKRRRESDKAKRREPDGV